MSSRTWVNPDYIQITAKKMILYLQGGGYRDIYYRIIFSRKDVISIDERTGINGITKTECVIMLKDGTEYITEMPYDQLVRCVDSMQGLEIKNEIQ